MKSVYQCDWHFFAAPPQAAEVGNLQVWVVNVKCRCDADTEEEYYRMAMLQSGWQQAARC